VNGSAFATHGGAGITAVNAQPVTRRHNAGNPTFNVEVTTQNPVLTNSAGYSVNSLRIEPAADGQSLAINDCRGSQDQCHSSCRAARLHDLRHRRLAGVSIGLAAPAGGRYIHVESATLTVSARVDGTLLALVKAGEGTLALTNSNNVNMTSPLVINDGIVRATPGSSLPAGEVRLRGGVLEIVGGGTFSRGLGRGAGSVNWAGIDDQNTPIDEDRAAAALPRSAAT
jgi:hypothetical protein